MDGELNGYDPKEERLEKERTIKQWLRERLPGYTTDSSYQLAWNCFASICYHYNYLKTNLHPNCILRNSLPFKEIPDDFMRFATTAYPWTKTLYTPSFTGIPPHVVQLTELRELKLKIDSLKEGVLNEIKDEMEKRGFASSEFNTHTVTSRIDAVGEMVRTMLSNVDQVRRTADQQAATDFSTVLVIDEEDDCEEENESETIHEENEQFFTEEEKQLRRRRKRERAINSVKKRKLTMGCHHGMLTPLPEDWEFPPMTWTQLIQNWFIGNKTENLPPFVDLNSKIVAHCNRNSGNRMRLNMKAMMRIVELEAREKGVWVEKKSEWTAPLVQKMIDAVRVDFMKKYLDGSNRQAEASWSTVYNRMSKAGVFKTHSTQKQKRAETTYEE
eukprot:CCRYP_014841-RA/>CCRYP_014841-RA protein AED:0.29 eAED:0.28 QI:0/0/0/1/1/1/2/0/385